MGKRAIVFGARGVTGWSFVNEILNDYPEKAVWDGVVAMTNRHLKQEDSYWPADPRLQIVSGVDLLGTLEQIEKGIKEKVKDVEKITHVYYLGSYHRLRWIDMLRFWKHTKRPRICRRSWKMP
jgi:hypothetical protein